MLKEEFENIVKEQPNIKNLPNSKLIEFMDKLTDEFESSKKILLQYSSHLDNVESLYNNILKEYQNRTL